MDASGHPLAPATAAASAAPSPAGPPVTNVAMTPAGGQLANLGAASLALGGTTAALGMAPASSLGSLAPALPALPELAPLAVVAPAVVLPLTLSGDTMANPNAPVPVPVQGQSNLSAWASPSQVTVYQTSPALFGLLATVQGTATLQYAPGGSPNSASLVDGQGTVQGTLQAGQITLTNPAALTFTPPGTPASVAPATPASTGTPSASSLAGVPVRLGDTAAMTVPDAGAIPATPGFTPAPPMPPLPGYSPPNLNLPPLTGIPIPDQPAMPISTGSPLPDVNLGNWQESFPISDPLPTILMVTPTRTTTGTSASTAAPPGYYPNADGTVNGPNGGSYAPTGKSDAAGNQIYVGGNGNYYTLAETGSVRVTSPNPPSDIGISGQIGEIALQSLGGQSQVTFQTTQGPRVIDQLSSGNIANEAKVGSATLDADTATQVAKDAELLGTGAVNGVTWNFYTSPITGLRGPSQPLADALAKAGIKVVYH